MSTAAKDRPASLSTAATPSAASSGAHQAKPQPAEISDGTGIMRPETFPASAAACTAIASAVLANVTTAWGFFTRTGFSYGRTTTRASSCFCAMTYMLVTSPIASFSVSP